VGLLGASIALYRLFSELEPGATPDRLLALGVYGLGLIGMLVTSALYNLSAPGRWKAALRRWDRAMIFVMIAGSCTPFVVQALRPGISRALCAVVWTVAVVGATICLRVPRVSDRVLIAMYLGMGWLVLAILSSLAAKMPATVLLLLLTGGIVYSLGVIVHTRVRVAFHNAAWHGMVLAAAGLHLTAVAMVLT
ncbi:MAG: hemolysin III family protein, partial [Acetobacteraceae bacterium]